MKLVAAGTYVLVKPIEQTESHGGILLPDSHDGENCSVGIIWSIGILAVRHLGPDFHVGAVVNFHTGAARSTLREQDGEYIMCNHVDIWCVRQGDSRGFLPNRSINGEEESSQKEGGEKAPSKKRSKALQGNGTTKNRRRRKGRKGVR